MIRRLTAKLILGAALLAAGTLAVASFTGQHASDPVRQTVPTRIALARPMPPTSAPTPAPAASPTTEPAYVIKRVLPIAGPMHHGDWHWDDAGVPEGPIVVTVDLKAQVLSIFRAGYEIGTAVILYGADAKPTPLGVYPVTQKDIDHISNLYDAPMPYMLRLTNDGVSIHASEVTDGYMTHGCIGVPTEFAKRLFGQVKLGDKVIVTRGETLDVGGGITAA